MRSATTNSTDHSGPLHQLLPPFEEQTGYKIRVITVGTDKASRMGRDGGVGVFLAADDEHSYRRYRIGSENPQRCAVTNSDGEMRPIEWFTVHWRRGVTRSYNIGNATSFFAMAAAG